MPGKPKGKAKAKAKAAVGAKAAASPPRKAAAPPPRKAAAPSPRKAAAPPPRKAAAPPADPVTPPALRASRRTAVDVMHSDAALFAPLTEGERADALRTLLEDERLRTLAKVGRYRVVVSEPLSVKPPDPLAGRRLARLSLYDYASDRCVDACVDLDRGAVCHVSYSNAQPALSADEELDAASIAAADPRVTARLGEGHVALGVMHYWSLRAMDFSFRRRSAAVLFGAAGARPALVAVVSLVDRQVVDVVAAEQW